MSNIAHSEACPECRANGHDKTGDHLIVFKDNNKFCNRAHHHRSGQVYKELTAERVHERINDKQVGRRRYGLSTDEISALPYDKLSTRDIPIGVCKIYGVTVSYDTRTREIDAHHYPKYNPKYECTAYKVRKLPKKFFAVGPNEPTLLFGQAVKAIQNAREVIICGGEEDALAATTMTGQRLSSPIYGVAPPEGENLRAFEIPEVVEFLKAKEKIYLALDNDEAGAALTKKLIDLLGYEKVRLVNFSEKDVSDMHTKEKRREFVDAVVGAKEYKPTGIVLVEDLDSTVCDPVPWGLSYPFESLTKITYGARTGEVIGIGAAPGGGKSTFIRQLQKHFIFEHKEKIAIFALEESVSESVKYLIGSIMRKPIHKPDCEYDIEKAIEIKETFNRNLYLFDCEEYHNWEDILGAVRYFHSVGVKYIFIDPLSALVAHLSASEANTFLNANMYKLEKMAKTLGLTFFHTNHLNNPQTGKDHGAGGKIYGSQFTGSRAQWKFSTSLWGLERDQLSENPYEKDIVRFSSIKGRMSGNTSSFLMVYKPETGNLEEDEEMIRRIKGE
jgi:twinkle protein